MAMDFWEAQRRARRQTIIYITIFIVMTLAIAALAEMAMRTFAQESYDTQVPFLAITFTAVTFAVAAYNYMMYKYQGGSYVAESLGGRYVDPQTSNPKERQLLNIVEEIALAASLPIPAVYLLPAKGINAFAAGLYPDKSAIAITTGAMEVLNRDELQGVIAHEFGHIHNGDMRITLLLAALVMGFFIIIYMGLRILQFSSFRSRDDKKGNPIILAAVILLVAGALSWIGGTILRSCVSRQREYLADASAVQFTRNPDGILNALKKIENEASREMPAHGGAYAHLYFDHRSGWDFLFATHPPLSKRIEAIEGRTFEDKVIPPQKPVE